MPLPPHIPADIIASLPHACGVYYFINARNDVIYIGKSVDIKQRVKSHFYAAAKDPKEKKLAAQTHLIKHTVTAGELSALLLESHEIKNVLPLYNRRLRRVSKHYSWRMDTRNGHLKPTLVDAVWPPVEMPPHFGAFTSLAHARKFLLSLTKQHHLCAKMLGLESSANSCFAYQLKQCKGACVGAESAHRHNQRVLESLADAHLEQWPFQGVIGVVELAAPDKVLVFDGWQFLGVFDRQNLSSAFDNNNSQPLLDTHPTQTLDRDSYKILLSFLKHKESAIEVLDFSIGL